MSEGRFDGQVAVVTGAGGGLGRASAIRLANEGANIVAVDLDGDAVHSLVAQLASPSLAAQADISSEAGVLSYMEAAVSHFGHVDLYHLNAGIFGSFDPLPDLAVEDFTKVIDVNVTGQFLGLREAFRRFRDQGTIGAIVVTASIASLRGSADLFAYQTSKHAVSGLIHGAAMYGGPLGIRVNGVAPGIVPTDLFAAAAATVGGKNDMERRASTTPLRRPGRPEEIASVVSFLLSEDASYMTGEIVSVDGGAAITSTVRPSGGAGAWDYESVDRALYRKGG